MIRILAALPLLLLAAASPKPAPDAAELTKLLNEFLAGASRNDAATHERFWSDDLIYTGSSGRRRGKEEILKDVRSTPAPKPGDPATLYTAEDVRIQQYGSTAVVAFRLVGTTTEGERTEVTNYLNTGTFVKKGGKWRVVAWQATRMPAKDEDAKRDLAAADATFMRALRAGDAGRIEAMTDDGFVWRRGGDRLGRAQVLETVRSGELKATATGTGGSTVAVFGDTGVVHGTSPQAYTLVFAFRDGAWRAVALHT
ncbi:MAG TPA: nuclear transport factor 2 family protein [Candidatus Polarisedimenticolaceae bacterium]|nr:nuclear transport factor 2 family protein [Candidatus Polarisedimenticolaceae bacterium]